MMTPEQDNFEQLSEALPSSFNFYHLGKVELQPDLRNPVYGSFDAAGDLPCGIGFYIQGDLNATLVILLEKNLDLSIYSELGNILASKITNQLYVDRQLQLTISPPQPLSEYQLVNVLKNKLSTIRKIYIHRYENQIVYLETLLVPRRLEGIGNA
ncbi:MAG: hypothetical protein ABIQ95_04160 [Bdellovibrionia bacterium]